MYVFLFTILLVKTFYSLLIYMASASVTFFLLLIFPFPFCFPFVCARCMNVWFPTAIKRTFGKTYIAIHSVFLHLAGAYYEHPMFVVHSYAHKETSVL